MDAVEAVWQRLEEVRAGTLQQLEALSQEALDRRPPTEDGEEAWSPGEVFMHLAIDEMYVRELIARPLLEGSKPPDGVGFLPPPPPHGVAKEVIRFWFERARVSTRRLLEAWPDGADMDLQHEGGLRAMNGLQWLGAYAGHEAFHLQELATRERGLAIEGEARRS